MTSGNEIRDQYDVAIIGAGPAGMAAATHCANAGMSTVLFDEQPTPGGQIYRGITDTPLTDRSILGHDYWSGAQVARNFAGSNVQYVPGATVWSIAPFGRIDSETKAIGGERGPELEIGVSIAGGSTLTQAKRIVIATGALERPFPIPGWTLPGVMTAGGAQTMLKASAIIPDGRTVLAGTGPLLWLLAWQLTNAGCKIEVILDTTPPAHRSGAWRHLAGLVASPYIGKGLRMLLSVRRRVKVIRNVIEIRAEGSERLTGVTCSVVGSSASMRIEADNLLLHQGVVPNVNLAMSVGIEHRWDPVQSCWTPVVDAAGATSVAGIYIAGDGAGIAGGDAAAARGVLTAAHIVRALNPQAAIPADLERHAAAMLERHVRGRSFLDHLYRPAASFRIPTGDTIVCRCEEVTAQQIVDTVALGCSGPNQMKSFLRCGMGPCQGRLCGLTVTEIIAQASGVLPAQVGYYRIRPPVKPITVAELAALPKSESAVKAVVRV